MGFSRFCGLVITMIKEKTKMSVSNICLIKKKRLANQWPVLISDQ